MPTFQVDLKDGRTVEFEADRAPTEDEFNQAIAQQSQQPEQPKTSTLGAAGRSAATGILPSAAAGAGFVAGAELGAPLAPATFGIAPLVTGAIGAGVAGYAASRAQQAGIHAVAPQFEQLQQADVEQHPVASAAGRIASMAPSFAIAPGQAVKGLAAIPALMRGTATEAGKKAATATAAQVGVQAGLTTAQTAIQEHKLPTAGELAEASVAALIYGQPRIKALLPRSVAAAAQATGVKPNASNLVEAAKIHGNVPTQPLEGAGQVSVEEGSAGVQPKAQVAQPQELRLSADDQAHLDAERGSVDVPVEVTTENQASRLEKVAYRASAALEKAEKQGVTGPALEKLRAEVVRTEKEAADAEEPFGYGNVSSINREKGTIEIYPEQFSAMLNQMEREGASPAKKRLAVRSLLAEERNHLAMNDADAEAYAGSLSAPELALERKLYTGKFGGVEGISPRDIGYEAIRRRMQRLERMDSTEVARAAGLERWSLKSLEALNDVVRKVRETLGTKASKEGLAILDKVQGNLDAAKAAVGGQPASLRRKTKDELNDFAKAHAKENGIPYHPWSNEKRAELFRKYGPPSTLAPDTEHVFGNNPSVYIDDATGEPKAVMGVSEGAPASIRRKTKDEGQAGFYLPGSEAMSAPERVVGKLPPKKPEQEAALFPEAKGQGALTQPPTEAATAAHPEFSGKPVTATELESDAARHLSETARPSFDTFASDARTKYGSNLQPGQLRELWQNQVWKRLQSASGSELGKLRDQLGLGKIVGTHEVADVLDQNKGFGLTAEGNRTAKALDENARTRAVAQQRYRANVEARIGEKLIGEADTGRKAWKRKEVTPDEVATWRESSEGAFRPISQQDVASPETLGRILTEGAATERSTVQRKARGGEKVEVRQKAPPESVTKRLTALVNKTTGKVELVSTYRGGRTGAMLVDPVKLGSVRPNVPLASILSRYRPIYSVLLDEPVQNFHQSFDSLSDFEQRFGQEAKAKVEEASRTAEPPAAATEAQPEPSGSLTAGKALQTPEAEGVLNQVMSETGRFQSPDDVFLAIEGLADDVKRQPSAKLNWPAINGFSKIYNAIREKWPLLDHDQAMAQMAEELYDRHQKAASFDEFITGATEAYQPEGRKAVPGFEGRPVEAAPRAGEAGTELTMPIERRPPTDVRPENVPPGSIPEKRPAPSVPEGGITPAQSKAPASLRKLSKDDAEKIVTAYHRQMVEAAKDTAAVTRDTYAEPPHEGDQARLDRISKETPDQQQNLPTNEQISDYLAAKAVLEKAGVRVDRPAIESALEPHKRPPASIRRLEQAKDKTLAEAERLAVGIRSMINRKDVSDALPKNLDAAENIANNVAREREAGVRLQAGSTKPGGGNKEVLRAANPVRDSGAVVGRFKMSDITPAAQAKFKLLYRDYIAKHPAANPFTVRIEALKQATSTLINEGDLRADRLTYSFNDAAKSELPGLMNQVDTAAAKARADLKGAGWFDKNILKKKLRFLQGLREELLYADKNWADPQLRDTAIQAQKEFDELYQRAVDTGSGVSYNIDHSPGRYEGEFVGNGKLLFPGLNVLGGRWKSPKTFDNIYEAVNAGPYMSITRDIASMVGHSARQVERGIARREYIEGIKNIPDPESGLPIAAEPVKDAQGNPKPPSVDYEIVFPFGGQKGIAIHRGWVNTVKALTGNSVIQEFPPARIALELAQRLKHTLLVGDFFHLGRLSYYGASIMGRKAGFKGGLAALDFRERDLPQAVRQGVISKEAADWVTERIPVRQGASTFMRSRREIAKDIQSQGLNVGQIQDALYKDLTGTVPIVGPYNKWLFDSYTRGLMMESAVKEFERLNKSNPNIDSKLLMRDIARDTNRFFGSIGRQGWFKSRTWQDLSRLAFLAPQWVEGLIMKEAGFAKRLVSSPLHLAGLPSGRRGLPPLGTLGKGIGYGLLTMMAMTQALNLITRRKPTWQNEEEGHKMDAWIPGGEHGFFLSPLSVFNELSHDLVRYFETKPKAWDAVSQIGQNKLSPFGRLALVLATSKSPTGEYQTTTAGLLGKAAEQVAPAPISFSKAAREVGHAVAPGLVAPNQPGAFQRQAMQWAGLKAEPVSSASQRVSVMAKRFMDENGLGKTGMQFEPTDDPSYLKLRSALRAGDTAGAQKVMKDMGKSPQEVGKAMKNWAARPWTVSKKSDNAFFAGLTDAEMETVSKARLERQQLLERFFDLLSQ